MFPGSNASGDLGYSKHNQFVPQTTHFLSSVAGGAGAAAAGMPLNMQMQGNIDWAQLAQQWIHMRDNGAAAPTQLANFSMPMPIAPPPPIISNTPQYQQDFVRQPQQPKTNYEEKGEADMDMDLDEENERAHNVEMTSSAPIVTQSRTQWQSSSNSNAVDADLAGGQQWNMWPVRPPPAPSMPAINSIGSTNPTAHIPSLLKLNVSNPNDTPLQQSGIGAACGASSTNTNTIDANKRKMLPAWIREGLEKMEREKQRQLERQQSAAPPDPNEMSVQNHLEKHKNVKQVSSKTIQTPVNLLNMSNVASDSEDSTAAADEAYEQLGKEVLSKPSVEDELDKTVDDDNEAELDEVQAERVNARDNKSNATKAATTLIGKSYEERHSDLMLMVRRALTEILLETTNEEIAAVAVETLKAHRAKASSAQVIRKSALSSITGNLGLAAYGDSSSESEEEEEEDDDDKTTTEKRESLDKEQDNHQELSVEDLKARIRKSKRAFEKCVDEIEQRVAQQQERDEERLQHHRNLQVQKQPEMSQKREQSERRRHMSNPEPPTESDQERSQKAVAADSKLQQFNGKRLSRKERTTRFSDNKDGKSSGHAAASIVSQLQQQQTPAIPSSTPLPQKLQPVSNPGTSMLQMSESVATMLSAADKALNKAQRSIKKSKNHHNQHSKRRSTSSSKSSSSSTSGDNSSSNSSSSSSSSSSNSSSSEPSKQRSRHRSSGSRHRYEGTRHRHGGRHRYQSSRDSRERDYHRHESQRHRRHRDSSDSDEGDGHHRTSRHSSSRSRSSYSRRRHRTRSRSMSRGTHNSTSSSAQPRRRH